ncbi:hypothetical protein OAH46_03295 [Verrucomicrobia bacterium]|nr:hypothetical protein [Verrucomicrobiota bacterium]
MAVEALDLELRQKAKAMIAHGSTSADVARVLGLHSGTVREWKRRYEWRSPSDAGDRVELDDIEDAALVEEYDRIMSEDVMQTLQRFTRMKVPRKLDDLLKRERCLELLSKRAERVMGKLVGQDAPKAIQIGQITAYLNDGAV